MSLPQYSYHNLFDKQRTCLMLLGDSVHKYVVYGGGAGGGKSWLGCDWLAGMALNFPNTRWFIARNVLKRLKESTLKTFNKLAKSKGFDHLYEYSEQKAIITFHNGSEIMLLEVKRQPSDPLFEDLGSLEFTGGFIEEAGEIDFDAFDTLKSRVGRQHNDKYNIPPKILITCNPKKNWLYHEFYKPFKHGNLEANKAFIQSLATDNPLVDSEYINALKSISNKAKRERLLYGNWEYDDNPYSLYDYDELIDCFDSPERYSTGKKYITCDVARMGKDSSIVIVWNGWTVLELLKFEKNTITDLAHTIKKLQNKHLIPTSRVCVDEDGVGGGLVDILKCKGFVNNSKALLNENYSNLRSQCGFRLQEYISKLRFDSDEYKEMIIEELEVIEEKDADKDNKLSIITREGIINKIGRSPDFFSAIMIRVIFELSPKATFTSIATGI